MPEEKKGRHAMTPAAQTLGGYLRSLREAKRLKLREVEEASGVSNPYLSQLENDKILRPSPHILHKLSAVYGVAYEILMEKAGYLAPPKLAGPPASGGRVPAAAFQDLTPEEEQALLDYLGYLRFRGTKE